MTRTFFSLGIGLPSGALKSYERQGLCPVRSLLRGVLHNVPRTRTADESTSTELEHPETDVSQTCRCSSKSAEAAARNAKLERIRARLRRLVGAHHFPD